MMWIFPLWVVHPRDITIRIWTSTSRSSSPASIRTPSSFSSSLIRSALSKSRSRPCGLTFIYHLLDVLLVITTASLAPAPGAACGSLTGCVHEPWRRHQGDRGLFFSEPQLRNDEVTGGETKKMQTLAECMSLKKWSECDSNAQGITPLVQPSFSHLAGTVASRSGAKPLASHFPAPKKAAVTSTRPSICPTPKDESGTSGHVGRSEV